MDHIFGGNFSKFDVLSPGMPQLMIFEPRFSSENPENRSTSLRVTWYLVPGTVITYIHTYILTYIHTNIHTYIHTYIHTG